MNREASWTGPRLRKGKLDRFIRIDVMALAGGLVEPDHDVDADPDHDVDADPDHDADADPDHDVGAAPAKT